MEEKREIRTFFDSEAAQWDSEHGPGSPRDRGFRENLETLRRILAGKPDGAAVLDIGCATGLYLFALGGAFERAVGVDVSPAMLAAARRRLETLGGGEIGFVQADSETLTAELLGAQGVHAGPFDLIWFIGSLEHIPDKPAALNAATGLLKPDGHLVVIMPNRYALEFLIERAKTFGRQPRLLKTDRHLTPREMRALAAGAGLRLESAEPVAMPIAHAPLTGRRRAPLADRARTWIPALRLLGTVAYTLRSTSFTDDA